jgi:hypothetical protein
MKTSKEIFPINEREELKGNYSPVIDRAIEALEAAEDSVTISLDCRIKEEKPTLKVGEWWNTKGFDTAYLKIGNNDFAGFDTDGEWVCGIKVRSPEMMQQADMKEVKSLLIGEAEKRYSEGDIIKSPCLNCDKEFTFKGKITTHRHGDVIDGCRTILFDQETGKWAEIVKKPLYVNQYGREYFNGDKYSHVINPDGEYKFCNGSFDLSNLYKDGELRCKFIGTKKECYQYLADNCKE